MQVEINEDAKDIISSLLAGWRDSETKPLVSGVSYNDLFGWLKSIGIDTTEAEEALDKDLKELQAIISRMENKNA